MCRVRQIIEIIAQRKLEEHRFTAKIAEWSTKNISSILVGLSQSDKQAKALAKAVERMKLPMADEINVLADDRTIEEIHEQGARVDIESQPSFEALSIALGGLGK